MRFRRKPDVAFTFTLPTYGGDDAAARAYSAMTLFSKLCTYTGVMPVVTESPPDGTITVRGRPRQVQRFRQGFTMFRHRGVL